MIPYVLIGSALVIATLLTMALRTRRHQRQRRCRRSRLFSASMGTGVDP